VSFIVSSLLFVYWLFNSISLIVREKVKKPEERLFYSKGRNNLYTGLYDFVAVALKK